MCKIEFIKKHKGLTIGFVIGGILILLSFLENIPNFLDKILSIFISFPLFIWFETMKLTRLNNDVLSSILFGIMLILYFSVLGEIIFKIAEKNKINKKKRYIVLSIVIAVIVLIHIFSYVYINRIFDNVTEILVEDFFAKRLFPALKNK